ncbi:MAG: hypothetical protein LH468_04170 [Nocardioides sp.]|nr:hypothetical protein [Nocardioides sp.]
MAYVQNGTSRPLFVDFASTDATGRSTFTDLDAATRAATHDRPTDADEAAIRFATSFKLFFDRGVPDAELHSNPGYLGVGFGGARTVTQSTAVPVNNTTASTASTANQGLPSAAGLVVWVAGATGAPVNNGGNAALVGTDALDPIDAFADSATTTADDDFFDDPATPAVEEPPKTAWSTATASTRAPTSSTPAARTSTQPTVPSGPTSAGSSAVTAPTPRPRRSP